MNLVHDDSKSKSLESSELYRHISLYYFLQCYEQTDVTYTILVLVDKLSLQMDPTFCSCLKNIRQVTVNAYFSNLFTSRMKQNITV